MSVHILCQQPTGGAGIEKLTWGRGHKDTPSAKWENQMTAFKDFLIENDSKISSFYLWLSMTFMTYQWNSDKNRRKNRRILTRIRRIWISRLFYYWKSKFYVVIVVFIPRGYAQSPDSAVRIKNDFKTSTQSLKLALKKEITSKISISWYQKCCFKIRVLV